MSDSDMQNQKNFCADEYRKDFPILNHKMNGKPMIYLDNAATTQMPEDVLKCFENHYHSQHANIARGGYALGRVATEAMENVRTDIKKFLTGNQNSKDWEVVFTYNATDSLNMVAMGLRGEIHEGDEIIVSSMEHHSNYVPWQQLCKEKGAILKVVPVKKDAFGQMIGGFDMMAFEACLSTQTRVVAVTEVSNLTGEIFPIEVIAQKAHDYGALVVVDGAQGVRRYHFPESCCVGDFYCFSAHKMFGPTGVGILFGRKESLERLMPTRFGGGMVAQVDTYDTTWDVLPRRLEAGTPNFPGIIAFGKTIEYVQRIGIEKMLAYEQIWLQKLYQKLKTCSDIQIVGEFAAAVSEKHSHIISFNVKGIDAFDIASYLDASGIFVRQGSQCAQPALKALGINGVIRVSPAFYNTYEEMDCLVDTLERAITFFKRRR